MSSFLNLEKLLDILQCIFKTMDSVSVLFLPVIGHKTTVPESNNLSWPSYAIKPASRDIIRNSRTETSVALRNSSPRARHWHPMLIYWLIGNSFSLLKYKLPIALTRVLKLTTPSSAPCSGKPFLVSRFLPQTSMLFSALLAHSSLSSVLTRESWGW